MKNLLLLLLCAALAGCAPETKQPDESATKLAALSAKIDSLQASVQRVDGPVRYAYLNKAKVLFQLAAWRHQMIEAAEQESFLGPELKSKLTEFDQLSLRLQRLQMVARQQQHAGNDQSAASETSPEIVEVIRKIAELRPALTETLNRRSAIQIQGPAQVDAFVTEYATGRFDLVLDISHGTPFVLYKKATAVPDMTDELLKFIQEKGKAGLMLVAPVPATPPRAVPSTPTPAKPEAGPPVAKP